MAHLNEFFDKLDQQISSKTVFDVNHKHCHLWQGAKTSDGLYGRKKVKFLDGTTKLMRVSRVVYMIKMRILDIPLKIIKMRQ